MAPKHPGRGTPRRSPCPHSTCTLIINQMRAKNNMLAPRAQGPHDPKCGITLITVYVMLCPSPRSTSTFSGLPAGWRLPCTKCQQL
eukprot:2037923-Prymnesium_polylepis.1